MGLLLLLALSQWQLFVHKLSCYFGKTALQETWRDLPIEKRIEHALVKGIDEFVVRDTEEARVCGRYPKPLNVSQLQFVQQVS